jgi:hypothetical protein
MVGHTKVKKKHTGVKDFFRKLGGDISHEWKAFGRDIATVYKDVKGGISSGFNKIIGLGNNIVNTSGKAVMGAEQTIGNVGSSLAMPLVLAGGAGLAFYFYNSSQKRRGE